MDTDKIEILHAIEIPGGDPAQPVRVIAERRVTSRDGKENTYINTMITVGRQKLFIPRRAAKDVARALTEVAGIASQAYTKLLADQNK